MVLDYFSPVRVMTVQHCTPGTGVYSVTGLKQFEWDSAPCIPNMLGTSGGRVGDVGGCRKAPFTAGSQCHW
jgi:hypothetical protein